ncbi:chitin-binding type-4 domain-containing protein [Caerostris extrusa]|uniref:Chitin-binding type-4 domain-containing protein n=1 Tax=Caerostris extrusa TaxID=172846 RepID=A0AAV4XC31_CAEEX|nr:chitin-binding type-4 domain-containing protein [Caerostris extrusa]
MGLSSIYSRGSVEHPKQVLPDFPRPIGQAEVSVKNKALQSLNLKTEFGSSRIGNMWAIAALVLVGGFCLVPCVDGHGRMVEPPARNTMWRMDFYTPENYDDTELFCGGLKVSGFCQVKIRCNLGVSCN